MHGAALKLPDDEDQDLLEFASTELSSQVAELEELMVQQSRIDPATFCSYVLRDDETNAIIENQPLHREWHRLISSHKRVLIWSHIDSAKAVPLTTEIPTPTGWATMGDLREGDFVFARDGMPCRVTTLSPVYTDRTLYKITFKHGAIAYADADHRWVATDLQDRIPSSAPSLTHLGCGNETCACGCGLPPQPGKRFVHNHHNRRQKGWRVVTTQEMVDRGVRVGALNRWQIPLCEPVEYAEAILPLPAYVLGAWLGDGDSSGARLTCAVKDREIVDHCYRLLELAPRQIGDIRWSLSNGVRAKAHSESIRSKLRALNVLSNKHIPAQYLQASVAQRYELLYGLMDTDGTCSKNGPRVSFANSNERLARDVYELVCSLGFDPSFLTNRAVLNGVDHGPTFRVSWSTRTPVFRLARKRDRQLTAVKERTSGRTIVSIEKVPSVPVRCISVDSPDATYLMGRDYVVTHNTTQISIGRVLWEIGNNPNIRVIILSNTDGQAELICSTIRRIIEFSPEFKRVFPHIVPDNKAKWTSHDLFVKRRSFSKDPTVRAAGVHGNILGSRCDFLVVDDILDYENTINETHRKHLKAWFRSTARGRLTKNSRMVVVGTAWTKDDLLHEWSRQPRWMAVRYPVETDDGRLTWEARWPRSRIKEAMEDLGPLEGNRQLKCLARSDEEARFKEEWITRCLKNGADIVPSHSLRFVPSGYRVYTGVDLGVRQFKKSDVTALFTIIIHPVANGEAREVLECISGRWKGPEIVDRVLDAHDRWRSIVFVESNAAQQFILDFVDKKATVPVYAFNTGKNKMSPEFGVESMAAEMARGKWIIPSSHGLPANEELQKWVNEMLFYSPDAHTGDRLMASWFSREAARHKPPAGKRFGNSLNTR